MAESSVTSEPGQLQSEWQLSRGQYLGEISALCFLHLPRRLSCLPFLLAGTGSQILVYDLLTANVVKSFQVFEGIRVHGISLDGFCSKRLSDSNLAYKIAIFGEKRVKLFSLCIEATIHSHSQAQINHNKIELTLLHALPKFSHWVLDVCFLKDGELGMAETSSFLAIGCTDNSVCLWDICTWNVISHVKSPDRCLLYSMRMWGDRVENLQVASGTIYNEIIIWRVSSLHHALGSENSLNCNPVHGPQYEAIKMCVVTGHEGSIFRISWSSNGLKLASVSDDRSARIWTFHTEAEDSHNSMVNLVNHEVSTILFGHSARVWDCCILDSLIITAGEDCTCRLWGLDGAPLEIIKEHTGRGVWRCLYDPDSSLLISAGFDSAIKVHHLPILLSASPQRYTGSAKDIFDRKDIFNIRIPNSSGHSGLTDSKSEYVRCLHFAREDSLYIATNNGFLFHATLLDFSRVKWSDLARVSKEAPIICMDLLSNSSDHSGGIEDWVAIGDGKGNMMILQVVGNVLGPEVKLAFSWSAELERQLLGTYWCKSLGYRYIFTADPRGTLKLWMLSDTSESVSFDSTSDCACLVAEFLSCFGMRVMCLDASFEEEVLVCGDIRGNLLVFPLFSGLQLITSGSSDTKIYPLNYFKGAHGISSVCSVSIARSSFGPLEIHTTGADGCICYLEYYRESSSFEFIGMKRVKELSTVRTVFSNAYYCGELAHGNYAVGFASSDFIIWNLVAETKVEQIECGGWRRPHSYYLGDSPEMKNCFAFVKDEIVHIHRKWVHEQERNVYPKNLHLQFHGREIHSLCFISEDSNWTRSCWIATGCEDGTVRLTRYKPGAENWSWSKLLGEHVGGSAVRSICFVSKMHRIVLDPVFLPHTTYREDVNREIGEHPVLLISVGAKRVVTCWKQKIRLSNKENSLYKQQDSNDETPTHDSPLLPYSSMSFQWLSTDMPMKSSNNAVRKEDNLRSLRRDATSRGSLSLHERQLDLECHPADKSVNDWRYLAVTAFLVKVADSRISVCFIVVACSDATLALRALLLPFRLWFDVALFAPLSSPVLALQHIVIPKHFPTDATDSFKTGSLFVLISGSTDGSIAFWDLTEVVESFMQRMCSLQMENYMEYQKRPRTGRGSQGGRWWRSLGSHILREKPADDRRDNVDEISDISNSTFKGNDCSQVINASVVSEQKVDHLSPDVCEIGPLHVLNNIHQSGVNCLHVSTLEHERIENSAYRYCVISGGDDQAVRCLRFDLSLEPIAPRLDNLTVDNINLCIERCRIQDSWMRFISLDKSISSHSSAVKGVWTNGSWVFSTGLDQRLRCWHIDERGKLVEHSQIVISVPEPESLDVRICGRNHYQIAVAGRGLQMIDFFISGGIQSGI